MEKPVDASLFSQLRKDNFHVLDNNTYVPNDLDTGDIILFSRQCSEMNLLGAAICCGAKMYSPWDHICVIVKDPDTNKLYAIEAATNGVKLFGLDDRINHSKAPVLAVRYLRTVRTDQKRREIWELAKHINGKPYLKDLDSLMRVGLWSPQKLKHSALQGSEYSLKQRESEIDDALKTTVLDPFSRSILLTIQSSIQSELTQLHSLLQTERKSRLDIGDSDSYYFCSHTVAVILRAMGVLPDSVSATEYMPYSFASQMKLPLLRGASFSNELYIRGNPSKFPRVVDMEEVLRGISRVLEGNVESEKMEGNVESEKLEENVENEKMEGNVENEKLEGNVESEKVESEKLEGNELEGNKLEGKVESEGKENETPAHLYLSSVLSSKNRAYLLTQLRLSRAFSRANSASLSSLLDSMELSFHLPGESIELQKSGLILPLCGQVVLSDWSDEYGERTAGMIGPFDLAGNLVHPTEQADRAKIAANEVAVLASADEKLAGNAVRAGTGLNWRERFELVREMQNFPPFSNLSWREMIQLSGYFYHATLESGEIMTRRNSLQSFVIYVHRGNLVRTAGDDVNEIPAGSFPGFSNLLAGRPSDCDFTAKSRTAVFAANPSVVAYFIGGQNLESPAVLRKLREPSTEDLLETLTAEIAGIRFYDAGDAVAGIRRSLAAVANHEPMAVDSSLSMKLAGFGELLRIVYGDNDNDVDNDNDNDNGDVGSVVVSAINLALSVLANQLYPTSPNTPDVSLTNTTTTNNNNNTTTTNNTHTNISHYSDEQILSLLTAFRAQNHAEMANYIMFIQLCGIPEICLISKEQFERRVREAGMMDDSNKAQIMDYFFSSKNTLDFDTFLEKMKGAIPAGFAYSISRHLTLSSKRQEIENILKSVIPEIVPKSTETACRQEYRSRHPWVLPAHSNSPALPLPVPYPMTFAIWRESVTSEYSKYVLGGLAGELFGRFMLYPTYLSAFTRLPGKNVSPVSLMQAIYPDWGTKMKRPGTQLKQPLPPPKPNETPKSNETPKPKEISPKSVRTNSVRKEPILVRTKSAASASNFAPSEIPAKPRAVNPVIGGFGRYAAILLAERGVQLFTLPLILGGIRNGGKTTDLPISLQTGLAGILSGLAVAGVRYPMDRGYMRNVLRLPKTAGITWREMLAGFGPAALYSAAFNGLFFGTFVFFWEANNRGYRERRLSEAFSRGSGRFEDQPVHYELLGKSLIVASCAYTAAHLVCYPLGVYKNMRMLRSLGGSSESPLFAQATSMRSFFRKANRGVLYGGLWTRVCWSVLSCSMGIAFGSAMLTKSYRQNNNY